ncbi:MAG TPA: sporulation protein [Rubrobacter sp.]|nr:sporulation protein [Rubrobacter sp.]
MVKAILGSAVGIVLLAASTLGGLAILMGVESSLLLIVGSVVCVALAIFGLGLVLAGWEDFRLAHGRSRAGVEILVDKGASLPGESVDITVRVRGKKAFPVKLGQVELLYENEYTYKDRRHHHNGDGDSYTTTEKKRATDRIKTDVQRFVEGVRITPGSLMEKRLSLRLPENVPPSARGKITKVEWKVKATLEIPKALDIVEEVPITVLSPAQPVFPGGSVSEFSGDCGMEIGLSAASFGPADRIEGKLTVTSREDLEARALRVELVRREIVARGLGNNKEAVETRETFAENLDLRAWVPQEHRFGLSLPERITCPSLRTRQSQVEWCVRAVAERPGTFDCVVEQPIDVHTASAAPKATEALTQSE